MEYSLRFTKNFEDNLKEIEIFLIESDFNFSFENFIDHLLENVFPTLMQFPKIGINYLQKKPHSLQVQKTFNVFKKNCTHVELREYIFDNYLLLYALKANTLFLLSIKHHKQLIFELDFNSIWLNNF